MFTKNNWLQKFGNDGVYFSKVTGLQCTDWNSTVKRLTRIFFLDYVTITSKKKKVYGGPAFY